MDLLHQSLQIILSWRFIFNSVSTFIYFICLLCTQTVCHFLSHCCKRYLIKAFQECNCLHSQVCKLEQENKMLETKWQLLQSRSKPDSKLEHMLKSYISTLRAQLDRANKDKEHLDVDLKNVHVQVVEQKQRSFIRRFILNQCTKGF